jgi:hypothetical protein
LAALRSRSAASDKSRDSAPVVRAKAVQTGEKPPILDFRPLVGLSPDPIRLIAQGRGQWILGDHQDRVNAVNRNGGLEAALEDR